jgi:hypothetical protein
MSPRWDWLSATAVLLLLPGGNALAQIEISEPTAGQKSAIAFSAFGGPNVTQGLYFYGASGAYDRLLTSKWEMEVSVDASRTFSASGKIERGISVTLNSGYALTERWSAELAFVKEFAKWGPDTNDSWKWANGDNAVGIGASYTIWEKRRHSLDVSVGLERNVTVSETSINFGLGYGFSF